MCAEELIGSIEPVMAKILEPHDLQRLDFTQLLCRKYGPSHYELSMNIRLAHKSDPETPETTY